MSEAQKLACPVTSGCFQTSAQLLVGGCGFVPGDGCWACPLNEWLVEEALEESGRPRNMAPRSDSLGWLAMAAGDSGGGTCPSRRLSHWESLSHWVNLRGKAGLEKLEEAQVYVVIRCCSQCSASCGSKTVTGTPGTGHL